MTEKEPLSKKKLSVDWFFHGVLTKIGDTFDRFTGRGWRPTSSLAASELIDKMKQMLDAEAKTVPGKGIFVPHNIKLMMEWNKVAEDSQAALKKLEFELLTAAVDHINDSLYYTYAPVTILVKADYFVEGVKLYASFGEFIDDEPDVALNLTIPKMDLSKLIPTAPAAPVIKETYIAKFEIKGVAKETRIEFPVGGSVSVGRTGSNALMIEDGSVSKIHASLSIDAEGLMHVADTGSTNGTFINDERIAYGKAPVVETEDHVKFGVIDVVFDHVPRPIVIETPETAEEDGDLAPTSEAIEIDGFQFKRGESPASPVADETPEPTQSMELPDETIRSIPIPSQTLRIDPIDADKSAIPAPAATPIPHPAVPIPPPVAVPVPRADESAIPPPAAVPIPRASETAIPPPVAIPIPKAVVLEPIKEPDSSSDDEPETRYK